jgi:transporter family protein
MSWIFYALLAPAVYSVINFTDKYIVEKELKDYSVVPIFSGIVAIIFGTAFWFVSGMPLLSLRDGALIMTSGVLSVFSYLVYLKALTEEETSNVTIFFQVTPVMVLILSWIFLHEAVSIKQYIGFFIILFVSLAMSYKPGTGFKISKPFWYIMIWDFCLAVSVIIVKFVVEQASFIKIFSYESWGVALGSLLLFVVSRRIRIIFWKTLGTIPSRAISILVFNECMFIFSKALTFFSFTLGPAVLVNVLEGTQVFYAVVYAIILMQIFPKVFKEDVSREGLTKKIVSACIMFLGIWLVY